MNILLHFIINIVFGLVVNLSLFEASLIGLGGVIIDIDHVFYMIFGKKIYSINGMWKFHVRENAIKRPHVYIFHFIEVILLIGIISYFVNWYLFLIIIGFGLHWIFDCISYLFKYKSFKPWINYLSLIAYIFR